MTARNQKKTITVVLAVPRTAVAAVGCTTAAFGLDQHRKGATHTAWHCSGLRWQACLAAPGGTAEALAALGRTGAVVDTN